MHYRPGDKIEPFPVQTITGSNYSVPNTDAIWTHLQFRRYAGCPLCNLHLRSMAKRHAEIASAGIREAVVFHSTVEEMLPFQGDLPFDVVADPGKLLYKQFGVEASIVSILHPAVIVPFIKSVFSRDPYGMFAGDAGGHTGFPADFLIGQDGVIKHVKYGQHAVDNWEVDELLSLVRNT